MKLGSGKWQLHLRVHKSDTFNASNLFSMILKKLLMASLILFLHHDSPGTDLWLYTNENLDKFKVICS